MNKVLLSSLTMASKASSGGVRRYQNPDGSLTAEGIKRYGQSGAEYLDAKRERKAAGRDYAKKFNRAYDRSIQSWSPIKSHREAANKRWEEAVEAADKYNSANDRYKAAKKKMKAEKKAALVDVSKSKNTATKRVAEDYHRLSDLEFAGKYKTSKKKFAKNFKKTDGDTYTLGRKKQAIAVAFLSRLNGDNTLKTAANVAKYDMASKTEQRLLDKGHEFAAAALRTATDMDLMTRYSRKY